MRRALFISDQVQGVRDVVESIVERPGWRQATIAEQLDALASCLFAAYRAGNAHVHPVLGCWHPSLISAPWSKMVAAKLSEDDFALAIAREFGFPDAIAARAAGRHDPRFETAVDAVVHGDRNDLQRLLSEDTSLATARSRYGHHASLLHYVAANGVETWRQVVPGNAVAILQDLIAAGAEVDALADMYGGSTPLGLVMTSAHPQAAGIRGALARALVSAGADGQVSAVDSPRCMPILFCSDLQRSIAALHAGLGFHVDWSWGTPADFAGVSLDRSTLYLCAGGQGQPGTWLFIDVADVDALRQTIDEAAGITVLQEPIDRPWGTREVLVRLPDDHVIRFAGPRRNAE